MSKAKYLRVLVDSESGGNPYHGPVKVNIRVPMQLLRAGVRLAGLIPPQAREHVNEAMRERGIPFDLSQIKPDNLQELVDHLNDLTIDVDVDNKGGLWAGQGQGQGFLRMMTACELRYSETMNSGTSPRWKRIVAIAVAALLLAYFAGAAAIYHYEPRLIFVPMKAVTDTPANHGAQFQPIRIPIGRDDTLTAWWVPGEPKVANPTHVKALLYLHGNYGNVGDNAAHAARLSRYGVNVLIPDYRGFGDSSGPFPSESRVYEDAETAWQWLLREKHYSPSDIVIYGHSLGGAIAIELASRHPDAAGLIVESSFTSVVEMARLNPKFRIWPMDWLVTQRFNSISRVGSLGMPALFIHGGSDHVVPVFMAQRMYDRAPGPKSLVIIPGGGHDNCAVVGGEQYVAAVKEFLEGLK